MKARPLYLHASQPVQVKLASPALYVSSGSSAHHIYPLRSLTRIQVSGPVEWQTAALLACIDQGITIQFLDRHGQTRGRLVGKGGVDHSLTEQLRRLFDKPDWEKWYRQWCWARGLQTRRYVANKLGYIYTDARDLRDLPRWCGQKLEPVARSTDIRRSLQWLHLDLYGYITNYLQQQGVWNENALALEEPIDLAHDLTLMLQWVLLLVRDDNLTNTKCEEPVTRRLVAGWFEHRRGYMKYQVARLINQLEIWIMETI